MALSIILTEILSLSLMGRKTKASSNPVQCVVQYTKPQKQKGIIFRYTVHLKICALSNTTLTCAYWIFNLNIIDIIRELDYSLLLWGRFGTRFASIQTWASRSGTDAVWQSLIYTCYSVYPEGVQWGSGGLFSLSKSFLDGSILTDPPKLLQTKLVAHNSLECHCHCVLYQYCMLIEFWQFNQQWSPLTFIV